jgi:hypothetical protein
VPGGQAPRRHAVGSEDPAERRSSGEPSEAPAEGGDPVDRETREPLSRPRPLDPATALLTPSDLADLRRDVRRSEREAAVPPDRAYLPDVPLTVAQLLGTGPQVTFVSLESRGSLRTLPGAQKTVSHLGPAPKNRGNPPEARHQIPEPRRQSLDLERRSDGQARSVVTLPPRPRLATDPRADPQRDHPEVRGCLPPPGSDPASRA